MLTAGPLRLPRPWQWLVDAGNGGDTRAAPAEAVIVLVAVVVLLLFQ